jgi:hypothetical protein
MTYASNREHVALSSHEIQLLARKVKGGRIQFVRKIQTEIRRREFYEFLYYVPWSGP